MKNFQLIKACVLVFFAALFFTFASNSAAAQTPDAVIKELYRVHNQQMKDFDAGKNNVVQIVKSRVLLNKFFDKNLAGLIWKDVNTHRNDMGVIDFDLFYNTQDDFTGKMSVGQAKVQGAKAAVPVSLNWGTRKETVTYLMVKQNGAWKIADIKYSGGTLLGYFKEGM
jgi:ABC-type transporter MlaC component